MKPNKTLRSKDKLVVKTYLLFRFPGPLNQLASLINMSYYIHCNMVIKCSQLNRNQSHQWNR